MLKELLDSPQLNFDVCPMILRNFSHVLKCRLPLVSSRVRGSSSQLVVQAAGMSFDSRPVYDDNKDRVYGDFASGQWIEQTQVC